MCGVGRGVHAGVGGGEKSLMCCVEREQDQGKVSFFPLSPPFRFLPSLPSLLYFPFRRPESFCREREKEPIHKENLKM